FRAKEWGQLAGLWHDLGKYRPEFQERIRGKCIHAPHASAGAALAMQRSPQGGLPLAFAIAGHHAG
ncbi:MAG: CRISPR-associated endonuclease Cas3'', partial [Planctomycetota bacterium]|nr:CRISPR-associated endonuclease Cas3'' [Planctomycetota bacterium]